MNKEILNLSIPNIISNLTIPLVGIVDVALMGHLKNEAYLGAIALGASIFTFIYAGLGFIRMGTSGFTAQSYGKRDIENAFLILARAFIIALICAAILILAQSGISYPAFYFVNAGEEVQRFATEYFKIRILAAPASLSLFAIIGWYTGMQNARLIMLLSIIINISNIVLSAFFVLELEMGIRGAALGTVMSQYIGLIVGLIFLKNHKKRIKKYWRKQRIFIWTEIKLFMNVNKNILIRSLLLTGSFYYFNAVSANLGDDILAANSILLQFLWIFSYFIDGFAFAAEALIGKYVGTVSRQKVKKTVIMLFAWGGGLSIIMSLLYMFSGQTIISLLTEQQKIIDIATRYHFWVVLIPIASFSAFIWDGIYIGATEGKTMRNAMIISSLFVFLPALFIFRNLWGNQGIWAALLIFMLSRGVSLHIFFSKSILKRILR